MGETVATSSSSSKASKQHDYLADLRARFQFQNPSVALPLWRTAPYGVGSNEGTVKQQDGVETIENDRLVEPVGDGPSASMKLVDICLRYTLVLEKEISESGEEMAVISFEHLAREIFSLLRASSDTVESKLFDLLGEKVSKMIVRMNLRKQTCSLSIS